MGKGKAGTGACACVCALGLTATMSDVAPSKDAFVVLMAAAKNPWYTMVIYRAWLEHADPEEPLWRVPYFGQVVRFGTAEWVFKNRKREHEADAAREDKDLGFHAVLDRFGPDALEWQIMSFKSGPRIAMQELANAEEKRLIAAHGGVLRDMYTKLEQTLNLTNGGQGNARAVWDSIEARCRCALNMFKVEMEKYVVEHESALVPQAFVTADGYQLGSRLEHFRRGEMRKGCPDEAKINAWAEALPKWAWDARETDEYRKGCVQRGKDQAKREEEVDPGYRSRRQRVARDSELPEKRAGRISKIRATMTTEAFRKGLVQRATDQRAAEVRAELERARPIAVPFEKSKKRRMEMRAASTDLSGFRGNAVLYMISEDGETIRRVQPDGNMGKKYEVGLVVDPAPPHAFDSD